MALKLPPPFMEKTESPLEGRESVPRDLVLLTKPQVANLLVIDVRSVERRIADGSLRSIKIGALVRVPVNSLRDFIERQSQECELAPQRAMPFGNPTRSVRGKHLLRDLLASDAGEVVR